MFVALAVVLLLLNKPEIRRIEGVDEYVDAERAKMGDCRGRENEHADRVRHHRHAVDRARHRRAGRRHRLERLRDRRRPARRGRGRRPRRLVALPAADRLEGAGVHAALERRRQDRLGHDRAVRHRHHLRLAAVRPGSPRRSATAVRRARPDQQRSRSRSSRWCWRSSSRRRRATRRRPRSWSRSSSRSRWPPGSTRSCPRWRRRSPRRSGSCCRCRRRRTRSSTAPARCRSRR